MSKRIQECRDRFTSLNKLFDRAIGVETWEISKETADKVEELHTKLHLKGIGSLPPLSFRIFNALDIEPFT
jgi:hypothetical protein